MSRHKLESELWVPAALDEVWEISKDPKNLAKLTPAAYGATIECDGPAREGSEVIIHMAPMGVSIPIAWVSLIENFKGEGDLREFTDVQKSGPFKFWKHRHVFEKGVSEITGRSHETAARPTRNMTPGTWVKDFVEYELPAGALGEVAHKIFARKNLENLFAYRRKIFQQMFGINTEETVTVPVTQQKL